MSRSFYVDSLILNQPSTKQSTNRPSPRTETTLHRHCTSEDTKTLSCFPHLEPLGNCALCVRESTNPHSCSILPPFHYQKATSGLFRTSLPLHGAQSSPLTLRHAHHALSPPPRQFLDLCHPENALKRTGGLGIVAPPQFSQRHSPERGRSPHHHLTHPYRSVTEQRRLQCLTAGKSKLLCFYTRICPFLSFLLHLLLLFFFNLIFFQWKFVSQFLVWHLKSAIIIVVPF